MNPSWTFVALNLAAWFLVDLVSAANWDAPPAEQTRGQFWRWHWYERGLTNGNPAYEGRFRVNSPEVSLHPTFGRRVEARENGLMQIRTEEDLFLLLAAEFYAEAWGGHPGTANKRITINGRNTYGLPRVGTEDGHCTYFYPSIPLRLTDLVNGYNAVQFAVDQGTTFWGHMLVDNAAIRVALTNSHPDLIRLGLGEFDATVVTEPAEGNRGFTLRLNCPERFQPLITQVDFQGWFYGYDENGNLKGQDWHGYTKGRTATSNLAVAQHPPFAVIWDTRLLPAQDQAAARAAVWFREQTNLVYLTAASAPLHIRHPPGVGVHLFGSHDLPTPFWSRAGQKKVCHLELDLDPIRIAQAELHVVTWTGGAGQVKNYFTLNGVPYPVAEGSRHELVYSRLRVDPATLRRGLNEIDLLSDTEHHGIEVLYPGPALFVRTRSD